jgi:hypothetical protein
MKVSADDPTRNSVAPQQSEEINPLMAYHTSSPLLIGAVTAGSEPDGDRDELPPVAVPMAVLEKHAGTMFSGTTGAVVPSGEGALTTAPTYDLCKNVTELMEKLPPALFDGTLPLEQRPCGLLDKYGAAGMLIGDLVGLQLMPWVLAEPVGKEAVRLKLKIPAMVKKAKKAAKRRGTDVEAAAAAVRNGRVDLKLPTADAIKAAWRRIAKVAQPPPPPPPETPAPEPPAPESAVPEPPVREPLCSRAQEYATMATSKEAALVIRLAYRLLDLSRGADEPDPSLDAELDLVQVVFKHALLRLQAAYPGEFDGFAEDSHRLVVDWTVRLYARSQKVPAAVAAAEEVGYNLAGAAVEFLLWRERADACRCGVASEECQCDGTLV